MIERTRALGRVQEARAILQQVGHRDQRAVNLARIGDLFDDQVEAARHLRRMSWAHNAVPFARAGLFGRARAILAEPDVSGDRLARQSFVKGEEARARRRFDAAIPLLQDAVTRLRGSSAAEFYDASLSLAGAYRALADPSQQIRVLEEAAREYPAFTAPTFAGAWWIKARVQLANAYREAGRPADALAIEREIRRLLSHADPDHPFLQRLGMN